MSVKTAPALAGDWLKHESDPRYTRDRVVLATTGSERTIASGTVLGRILTQTPGVATAAPGNTGNGAMGTVTVGAGAVVGSHRLEIVTAAANGGQFTLRNPAGALVGMGRVGVAFAGGGLAFTLADGGTDFVAGDAFTIAVADGSGKLRELAPAGADGTERPAGILLDAALVPAGGDTVAVAVMRGPAIVRRDGIAWPDGFDAAAVAAGEAALAALGIVVRAGA
ncbi:MAG: head decoration protein [Alphaproteobacteria bacterium]